MLPRIPSHPPGTCGSGTLSFRGDALMVPQLATTSLLFLLAALCFYTTLHGTEGEPLNGHLNFLKNRVRGCGKLSLHAHQHVGVAWKLHNQSVKENPHSNTSIWSHPVLPENTAMSQSSTGLTFYDSSAQ